MEELEEGELMESVFVYGTLRPGGGNYPLLQGTTVTEESATADGLALYSNDSGSFPYATTQPGRTVSGTLCTITDHQWPAVQRRLDLLEGFHPRHPDTSHYLRRRWPVRTTPINKSGADGSDGRSTVAWLLRCRTPRPHRLVPAGRQRRLAEPLNPQPPQIPRPSPQLNPRSFTSTGEGGTHMCGLFGMTLPRNYPTHLLDRGAALALLGELAEDRGRDAAGLATRHTATGTADRWTVDKVAGPYRRLSRRPGFNRGLGTAETAIGHTRWATQGSLDIANASPAWAGTLLCTHNGDVDVHTIPYATHTTAGSGTDSAVLFSALATAHPPATAHHGRVNTRRIVSILSRVHGRAALAWTDTAHTNRAGAGGRVWLARAGLCPLAVGVDVDGGLWWASNPAWLRRLSHLFDLPFASLRIVAEGTLLSATPQASTVKVTEHAQFKPTVRVLDQRLASTAVWRGFGYTDQRRDQARQFHRTATTSQSRPLPPTDMPPFNPHPFDQHRLVATTARWP